MLTQRRAPITVVTAGAPSRHPIPWILQRCLKEGRLRLIEPQAGHAGTGSASRADAGIDARIDARSPRYIQEYRVPTQIERGAA
jgi:hypothetical protein